jgi:hypothetical protein
LGFIKDGNPNPGRMIHEAFQQDPIFLKKESGVFVLLLEKEKRKKLTN